MRRAFVVGFHSLLLPLDVTDATVEGWWSTQGNRAAWYARGAKFWSGEPASYSGVLCGSGHMHDADIRDSRRFLTAARGSAPALWLEPSDASRATRALDVGGGVGRVSRSLLLHLCDVVDLCDGCEKFVRQAQQQLGDQARLQTRGRMDQFIHTELQSFVPTAGRYDLVWVQWCTGHLTDGDLARLLRDCGRALAPGGLLVVKDNTFDRDTLTAEARASLADGRYLLSEGDASVIRSREHLEHLVGQLEHLKLVAAADAELADAELYPVATLALSLRQ